MFSLAKVLARALLPKRVLGGLRCMYDPGRFAFLPGMTYCKDGLATIHNTDFLERTPFREAYYHALKSGCWEGPWGKADPQYRAYVVCWAAMRGAGLDGDFVECGVYKGGYSRTAMDYIGFKGMPNRLFYLLDTFCGIPESCFVLGEKYHDHRYQDSFAWVQHFFSEFPNVRLVRGMVPDTLALVKAEKICYLSIDMNVTAPEIAAAEYFWDRLVPGGIIVLDDYGWKGHELQKQAFDEFAQKRGEEILAFPTGQGLLIKKG